MKESTLNKRLRIGKWTDDYASYELVIDVQIDADGELHIVGDTREIAKNGRPMEASGGQNRGDMGLVTVFDGVVTKEQTARLSAIWDRWHLNHMRAGTPKQEEWLRMARRKVTYPKSQYDSDSEGLRKAGLNPDTLNGEPYQYGHRWLREELPDDVVTELVELTTSGVTI